MEQAFDPYYRWLAIPPEEHPPNYYRLLGVKLFETDVEVISTAADRQMAHIRTYQVGQHAAESQKLLNEIATARIWLLNPGKRSAYDHSLRAKLKPAAPPQPPQAQPLRAIPIAVPAAPVASQAPAAAAPSPAAAQGEFDALADIADAPRTSHRRPISNKRSPLGPLVAIGTICLVIVVVAVYLKTRPNEAAPEQIVENPPHDDAPDVTTAVESKGTEKKPKSTGSAETKSNSDPVTGRGDAGEGSEQLLAARKALAERDVAEARLQLRQAEKKQLGNEERLAVTRLRAIAGLLDDFWTAVRSATGRLQRNDEIIFDGEPLAVVIDANPKQLTLRWEGRNRTFAPEALPANIALALAEMQLRNKPAGNAALGAFLAMDADGDRQRARDLWLMAAQKGQKTKTLMAELDVPLAVEKPDNLVAGVEPDEDSMPVDPDDTSSTAASHEESAVERVPAPSGEAIQSAVKVVRQVYKQDFAQAKRVTEKESLADKLLSDAASSRDPSERYALFSEARALAMSAASVPRVVAAVEGIGKYFEIDALDLAADALERLNDRDLQVLARKELAEAAAPMFDRAVAAGKFDTAQRLGTVGVTAARKAGERELAKKLAPKNNELAALRRQVDAGLAALKTLEEKPDDEAANLAAGKYLCLINEDWMQGLPLLAKGSDRGLKQLAASEVDPPDSPENQAKLGDAWWDLAEKEKGKSKESMQRRAGYWYQQAVEELTGLSKAKVEKRLAEIPADTARTKPKPKGARDANASKKLPPAPPAHGSGDWIDLLAAADVEKHAIVGRWTHEGSELACRGTSLLMLPITIDGSYRLELDFTRTESDDTILLRLPAGKFNFALDLSGFHGVNSRLMDSAGSVLAEVMPGAFINGHNYKLAVDVQVGADQASIRAKLDGQPYLQWKGAASALGANAQGLPDRQAVGIGGSATTVATFHSAQVRLFPDR